MPHRVIIIDAYDSFVHILAGYFEKLGCEVSVIRKDDKNLIQMIEPNRFDILILGPGPGHPEESGYIEILKKNNGAIPVLGVCLGHQAIALYYGSKVKYVSHLMHGKISSITHDSLGCFQSLKKTSKVNVMRYNSIIVDKDTISDDLQITATSDDDGYIMGIRHKNLSIEGIQFHPESVGTENGLEMLHNFIKSVL